MITAPLNFIPAKQHHVRRRRQEMSSPPSPPPPPVALGLAAASVQAETGALRLTFDRAIDASGLDASQIYVQMDADPGFYEWFLGTGAATVVDAQTIDVTLADQGGNEGGGTFMNASAATGIVAADDGGTWVGVTGLALPYP